MQQTQEKGLKEIKPKPRKVTTEAMSLMFLMEKYDFCNRVLKEATAL